jgi:nitroreductase
MNKTKLPAYKAITSRRTIRRFKQKQIPKFILKRLINTARLSPSAANLQPLEFMVIIDRDICAKIFPHLRWAGYISPYGTPPLDKRPVAYIAAWEQGIGSCWMQAINRAKIKGILNISKDYLLDSIISLGYRAESCVVEQFRGSIKYWKDKQGTLHVPKRDISQIYKVI